MFYLLGILVAIQLVVGQALWKIGTQQAEFILSYDYIASGKILKFIFLPATLIGMIVYASATLMYMGVLSKYPYSAAQGLILPASLIFAFIVARVFFHDRISLINLVGLVILIIGIWLATKR